MGIKNSDLDLAVLARFWPEAFEARFRVRGDEHVPNGQKIQWDFNRI